ncbi:phage portal protein [Arthrobacter woluwensis]|uniref:phage portal protein n=1 Tax=Arthrobacter woluwensis TaxID=156980 RepID=UPI001AAF5C3C|nr:phage portal protein [Arthrobacter woluwensis]QTF71759.1 phage portal protein [Arthrobacter woluwensis]
MSSRIAPPSRSGTVVSAESATSLHSVYRALMILTGAAAQISIDALRNGSAVANPPAILRRPSLAMDRPDFIEQTVMSLAVDGNFFWHKVTANGAVVELELWNPFEVGGPYRNEKTGAVTFRYRGKEYPSAEVITRDLMKLPGQARGRSVIQACREDMAAAINTRDFANQVFEPGENTTGLLSTDSAITKDDATAARRAWRFQDPVTGDDMEDADRSGIRVLGKGFKFERLTINPKDAQWLESQDFSVTAIARMFGVPASLMLAVLQGGSQTYANVSQDWLAFVRFTLVNYLRKIESAFGEVLPLGQDARFNLEALLRADTETRYKGHSVALGRWMTVDEVRSIENLPPLTDAQREELNATPAAPAPAEGVTQ